MHSDMCLQTSQCVRFSAVTKVCTVFDSSTHRSDREMCLQAVCTATNFVCVQLDVCLFRLGIHFRPQMQIANVEIQRLKREPFSSTEPSLRTFLAIVKGSSTLAIFWLTIFVSRTSRLTGDHVFALSFAHTHGY